MADHATERLAAALASEGGRSEAARLLAQHVGAEALLILVEDQAVDALLPAPGFPPTLPGGSGWRDLLGRARRPGPHEGRVDYPVPGRLQPAIAQSGADISLVFIGGTCDPARLATLDAVIPLIAATLRAEHAAVAARGELRAAQDYARQAGTLARALDSARAEIERTVLALERQARELQEAQARAEDAMQAKDEFLAMLGHELRNPLSPILTALQLMRLKGQSGREQDVIERQVDSLMRLVDDLLDVSRITRGKIELRKVPVELAEIAARAIEMSSPILEKKAQLLAVDVPRHGFVVHADPSRLAQVLANLLTNAAKYSDPETRITFAAERDGSHVRIRVKDEGIGIAPEMIGRVFDLFVQQRQSVDRSQGGLGLGLAIVHSLVALHGGTVRAHSAGEGTGSEFTVELPRLADEAVEAPLAPVAASMAALARTAKDPERVLVVDDNEDAAALLAEALRALGYVVSTAPDAPTALRIADEFDPQVALLDIGLPVIDGYELAQRLRATRAADRLRLVAVTGYGQGEDKRRARAAGFDAHLVRPIALDQLQQVFGRLDGSVA